MWCLIVKIIIYILGKSWRISVFFEFETLSSSDLRPDLKSECFCCTQYYDRFPELCLKFLDIEIRE